MAQRAPASVLDNLQRLRANALHEFQMAPTVAMLAANATPPNDNRNLELRVRQLEMGLCGGPCANGSTYAMREPNGCMGKRGVSPARRFKWLSCGLVPPDCLVVSVGIGMEWDFEVQAAARGCEVHALDPTMALREAHTSMAAIFSERYPRLHFHFLGLSSERLGQTSEFFGTDLGPVQPLDAMLRTIGVLGRRIDVLKIDCEGCEWSTFTYLARRHPRLLCRVNQLNIELHVWKQGGLVRSADLPTLLSHIWVAHGFRAFRAVINNGLNPGDAVERRRHNTSLLDEVRRWGLDNSVCCHNLHLLRPATERGAVCDGGAEGEGEEEGLLATPTWARRARPSPPFAQAWKHCAAPVAIGGVAGSGTRVVATAVRELGFQLHGDHNLDACDAATNWTTLWEYASRLDCRKPWAIKCPDLLWRWKRFSGAWPGLLRILVVRDVRDVAFDPVERIQYGELFKDYQQAGLAPRLQAAFETARLRWPWPGPSMPEPPAWKAALWSSLNVWAMHEGAQTVRLEDMHSQDAIAYLNSQLEAHVASQAACAKTGTGLPGGGATPGRVGAVLERLSRPLGNRDGTSTETGLTLNHTWAARRLCSNLDQLRRVESIAAAAMQTFGYTRLPSAHDEQCRTRRAVRQAN